MVFYGNKLCCNYQVLSMKTADNAGSTVILANDPDADRLALAENDG
jgi:phosphomannomutase